MTRLLAITWREYASFFRMPLGWIVVALFLALSGIFFTTRSILPGEPASMRVFFGTWWSLLVIIAPAISMRLLSEELKAGTIEPLMTAPVAEGAIVGGKYAAAVLFLCTMLCPTLVYVAVLGSLASPDPGPIVAGYLGIVLLGMLYLAAGTFVSALTSSQTLAFLGTLFLLLMLEILATQAARAVPEPFDRLLFALSPNLRAADFARGVIDTGHIVFFLAASAWFLTLATVTLEFRRWR